MLKNKYWCFKSALSHKFCDEVIKYGLSLNEVKARTGQDKLRKKNLKARNSDIAWITQPWVYKEIHEYVHVANKNAGWNFDWDCSEDFQFTKYKIGQYYDWHCDSWEKPNDDERYPFLHGKIRKLSVTCQLTDKSEYEGGELEFDFRNYDPNLRNEKKHVVQATEILTKGSIIVFPSHLWHRVKPVTSGTRYSLVAWNLGYPFK
tara:strand:- start:566 stop:1177 length:612 start_codon:yes stop_codon:yes gene_type:complete